jgi:hypothetical protein
MSDQPSAIPQQPPPSGVIVVPQQHAGIVSSLSSGMFDAFKTSPVLLLIVILNMTFAGVAGYYLLKVEEYRAKDRESMSVLLSKCLTESVPVDYLRGLNQR